MKKNFLEIQRNLNGKSPQNHKKSKIAWIGHRDSQYPLAYRPPMTSKEKLRGRYPLLGLTQAKQSSAVDFARPQSSAHASAYIQTYKA